MKLIYYQKNGSKKNMISRYDYVYQKYNLHFMNEQKINYIKSLREKGLSDSQIRKQIRKSFGVKKTRGNEIYKKIFCYQVPNQTALQGETYMGSYIDPKIAKAIYNSEDGIAESIDSNIRTLDELLEACKVDLNIWQVDKYIVNKWATARSNKTANLDFQQGKIDGGIQDNGGMSVTPLFQIKAWLKRKTEELNAKAILEEFIKRANENAPNANSFIQNKNVSTGSDLLEISVPDLHLAKLCWGKETGNKDYDINIASKEYKKAVFSLYQAATGKINRILLPVGNDIFNSDNMAGTTTKGTPQAASEDSRWPKTFMVGCQILVDAITQLAQEVPVDVVIVAGNHDKERCFYLGEYLKAWFRNSKSVSVNNEPRQRKYYRFGQNLIGFTHGNEEKPDKLPMLMANEEKQAWSETKFRQWHLGHLHHEISKDIGGVVVRFLPSLCPPDEWHTSKGYIGSILAAQAFQYNQNNGLTAIYYHNS